MSNRQHSEERPAVDELRDRLDAVERALTDGADDRGDLRAAADVTADLADVQDRVATLEDRIDELDAATQALRGYVGNVRSVNRDVEQRADAALAKVETLESELDRPLDADVATDSDQPAGRSADPHSGAAADQGPTTGDRPAGPKDAREPCRCVRCGAPRDEPGDGRPGTSGTPGRREREERVESSGGRRPTTDGGHEEWARETAGVHTGAEDSDDGFLSGLRDAL